MDQKRRWRQTHVSKPFLTCTIWATSTISKTSILWNCLLKRRCFLFIDHVSHFFFFFFSLTHLSFHWRPIPVFFVTDARNRANIVSRCSPSSDNDIIVYRLCELLLFQLLFHRRPPPSFSPSLWFLITFLLLGMGEAFVVDLFFF